MRLWNLEPTAGRTLLLAVALLVGGCRSAARRHDDAEVRRHAEAAHKAFAAGHELDAIKRYRRAVRRAWAIDDAVLIGRNAYNLAAAHAGIGRFDEARDWLAEARAEMSRAGQDTMQVQILAANIARQQGLWYEAQTITATVARAVHIDRQKTSHCPANRGSRHTGRKVAYRANAVEEGNASAFARLLGKLESDKRKSPQDRHEYVQKRLDRRASEVQVHLLRAQLAADRLDLRTAEDELDAARRKLRPRVNRAVASEVERVAGRILVLAGRFGPAAARFDDEARLLRQAESYRGIPVAYQSSAEAYEMAGLEGMAVDRYVRAARMLYARDAVLPALRCIDRALPLAMMTGNRELQGRLAVVFNEIARTVEARDSHDKKKTAPAEPIDPPAESAWHDLPELRYENTPTVDPATASPPALIRPSGQSHSRMVLPEDRDPR